MDKVDVQCIGPFGDEYRLAINGYRVPYLTAHPENPQQTKWVITLDERFGLDVDSDGLQQLIPFIANAMAVAAGYTCHGENCMLRNPFTKRMIALSVSDIDAMNSEHDKEHP